MTDNVINFALARRAVEDRGYARFEAIHYSGCQLESLPAHLGTPAEWLTTAISHLKVQECTDTGSGFVEVSAAAISLVMHHIEALEQGAAPWAGNAVSANSHRPTGDEGEPT